MSAISALISECSQDAVYIEKSVELGAMEAKRGQRPEMPVVEPGQRMPLAVGLAAEGGIEQLDRPCSESSSIDACMDSRAVPRRALLGRPWHSRKRRPVGDPPRRADRTARQLQHVLDVDPHAVEVDDHHPAEQVAGAAQQKMRSRDRAMAGHDIGIAGKARQERRPDGLPEDGGDACAPSLRSARRRAPAPDSRCSRPCPAAGTAARPGRDCRRSSIISQGRPARMQARLTACASCMSGCSTARIDEVGSSATACSTAAPSAQSSHSTFAWPAWRRLFGQHGLRGPSRHRRAARAEGHRAAATSYRSTGCRSATRRATPCCSRLRAMRAPTGPAPTIATRLPEMRNRRRTCSGDIAGPDRARHR